MKKHFWKLEYSITIFVILAIIMLLMPLKFDNYIQAGFMNQWKDKYQKISYVFSVINAQESDNILKSLNEAKDAELKEKLLIQLMKPYLRMEKLEKVPFGYKIKFLNGEKVTKSSYYYFSDLYYTDDLQVVGIKDLPMESKSSPWYMMMFDVNGFLPPNVWGKDVYGIYIYDEGRIEPFGHNISQEQDEFDCIKTSRGLTCSDFYLIGGELND